LKILAIETATFICGVAYVKDGHCVSLVERECPRTSAEELPGMVKNVQRQSGFKWEELDGIAVSIGPGSFTGLRIGLSFSKGLAYSHNLPVVPVPTLAGMANNISSKSDSFRIALFSHRNLFYTQVFHHSEKLPSGDKKPVLWDWETLQSGVEKEKNDVFICGGEHITSENEYKYFSPVIPSAKWIGLIAHERWDEYIVKEPFQLIPDYIAPFEIKKRKNAVS
jgi:tRNA threonylcarbamoyladenosine biosynthesis protein TsaB